MHGFLSFFCLITFLILSLINNGLVAQEISLNEPVENWTKLVRESNVETKYEVKKGDNLYDISDILFGDAHYWPKVWSLNTSLTNPHNIEIGQIIYFDSGNVVRPPSISLATKQDGAYLVAESIKEPIIPKQAPRIRLKEIPQSLPQLFGSQAAVKNEERQLEDIEIGKRFVLEQKESVFLYTEINNNKPKSLGVISTNEDDSYFARVGEFVVLDLTTSVSVGEVLSVFNEVEDKELYSIIDWVGEVEVLKPIGNTGLKYKARVLRANQEIARGSKLSLKPLRSFTYKDTNAPPKMSIKNLEILGGESTLDRTLFNDGDVVYLNRGNDDGISEGDIYLLERSLKNYYSFTKANDVPGAAAFVKIISSDTRYSTGVLYNMNNIVGTGQKTRTSYY